MKIFYSLIAVIFLSFQNISCMNEKEFEEFVDEGLRYLEVKVIPNLKTFIPFEKDYSLSNSYYFLREIRPDHKFSNTLSEADQKNLFEGLKRFKKKASTYGDYTYEKVGRLLYLAPNAVYREQGSVLLIRSMRRKLYQSGLENIYSTFFYETSDFLTYLPRASLFYQSIFRGTITDHEEASNQNILPNLEDLFKYIHHDKPNLKKLGYAFLEHFLSDKKIHLKDKLMLTLKHYKLNESDDLIDILGNNFSKLICSFHDYHQDSLDLKEQDPWTMDFETPILFNPLEDSSNQSIGFQFYENNHFKFLNLRDDFRVFFRIISSSRYKPKALRNFKKLFSIAKNDSRLVSPNFLVMMSELDDIEFSDLSKTLIYYLLTIKSKEFSLEDIGSSQLTQRLFDQKNDKEAYSPLYMNWLIKELYLSPKEDIQKMGVLILSRLVPELHNIKVSSFDKRYREVKGIFNWHVVCRQDIDPDFREKNLLDLTSGIGSYEDTFQRECDFIKNLYFEFHKKYNLKNFDLTFSEKLEELVDDSIDWSGNKIHSIQNWSTNNPITARATSLGIEGGALYLSCGGPQAGTPLCWTTMGIIAVDELGLLDYPKHLFSRGIKSILSETSAETSNVEIVSDFIGDIGVTGIFSTAAYKTALKIPGNYKDFISSGIKINIWDVKKPFNKWKSAYWSEPKTFSFQGKGFRIYQRNDLFDPYFIDPKSKLSNLELMSKGRSPIGYDGKPVNLHHLLQTMDGPLAEIAQTMHTKYDKILHINPKDWPSGIDRVNFDKFRKIYWKNRETNI